MMARYMLLAAITLISAAALAQEVDQERARQLAALIIEKGVVEQYCGSEDSPPYPSFTDEETEAACDIIANSEDD
jgi:hypothetical protein